VITNYRPRSYQIEQILWDETPRSMSFIWKRTDETGKVLKTKVTVEEYMKLAYDIKLEPHELNQPLLMLT
jgi:hypothetical protein